MRTCANCNSGIKENFKFCPFCGCELEINLDRILYDKDDYPQGFNPELYEIEEPQKEK